jgi:hypothetical protein
MNHRMFRSVGGVVNLSAVATVLAAFLSPFASAFLKRWALSTYAVKPRSTTPVIFPLGLRRHHFQVMLFRFFVGRGHAFHAKFLRGDR